MTRYKYQTSSAVKLLTYCFDFNIIVADYASVFMKIIREKRLFSFVINN
ncbi:hypothetical protein PISS_a0941 [Pseudoalteromonas issachenkonii]|uniref:Uncharacterized protein n=1 Tax=Pseudoalteromonas issachenkonii TaxID=152297 RepID=A0ABM6N1G8_9GAMM|nr:hypothetical protein PISS_a0941 [Pseudoalteromonas issachenkonii]